MQEDKKYYCEPPCVIGVDETCGNDEDDIDDTCLCERGLKCNPQVLPLPALTHDGHFSTLDISTL